MCSRAKHGRVSSYFINQNVHPSIGMFETVKQGKYRLFGCRSRYADEVFSWIFLNNEHPVYNLFGLLVCRSKKDKSIYIKGSLTNKI